MPFRLVIIRGNTGIRLCPLIIKTYSKQFIDRIPLQ